MRPAWPLVLLVACGSDHGANAGDAAAPLDATPDAFAAGGDAREDAWLDGGVDASGDASGVDAGLVQPIALSDASSDASGVDAGLVQAIGLPMYVYPSDTAWTQARMAAPTVALLIANVNSGPGTTVDSKYTQALAAVHAVGQSIIGYVHTSYGARPIAQVQADIDAWYALYPAIDGIFSDETSTDATQVAPYYKPLYDQVKGKSGQRTVVINPGTATSEAYMQASDIVMSYEDTYANYVNAMTAPWVSNYASKRFWHIVLSASQTQMENAVTLARQRNAGVVYVTDQGPATAYQTFVTGAYWLAELAAVTAP